MLWACRYAASTNAELMPLHVVHDPASAPGFYRTSQEYKYEPMQTVAEDMMADFLADIATGSDSFAYVTELETHIVPGLPPTRIIEVAEMLEVDLVVIGCRGRTGLPHRLLGSTSERVMELSPFPVVVVKSEHHGKLGKKAKKRHKKKLKKERRKLEDILGLRRNDQDSSDG